MSGLDQARPDEGHQSALQRGFLLDIQLRRIAPQGSKNFFRILGRAELQLSVNRVASFIRAQQDDFSSGIHEIHLHRFVDVFENSDHPNHRSGVNTLAESFVVEADIAAGNRRIKFLASFGNPVNRLRKLPHNVRQFSQTIDGITKACEELDTPITGGNVSFYNETLGEGIYPTPVIGVVGILEDVHKTVKMNFVNAGRKVVLLRANEAGDAVDAELEFGSSEYAKEILGALWGYPPELDIEKEATLQRALVALVRAGLVESAHDCSDGGLAVALVESALPGGVGFGVRLPGQQVAPEFLLFGEDASRVVLSCDPIQLPRIQQVAEEYGVFADVLGETGSDRVEIAVNGQPVISASVAELREAYEGALERALRTEPGVAAAD